MRFWSSIPHWCICFQSFPKGIPAGPCFHLGFSVARTPFSNALPMLFSFVRIASEDGLQHRYRPDQIQGLQNRSFQKLTHYMLLTCDHRVSGPPLKGVHACVHVRRKGMCVLVFKELWILSDQGEGIWKKKTMSDKSSQGCCKRARVKKSKDALGGWGVNLS